LDGIIEFRLPMSARKIDRIDWSAGGEEDTEEMGDVFGLEDDFMHLDATFAKLVEEISSVTSPSSNPFQFSRFIFFSGREAMNHVLIM
jgi:hypothetical protein